MSLNEQKNHNTTEKVPGEKKLPTKEKAWEEVMKRVEEIDGGMEKGWKEDIDTLLVFAGLFSAVVTAFTIESYQWLSEDPADQNIAILTQISAQLNDRNATHFEPTPFTPSPSVVRINTFWFLSLILALVDALFGLMCKQWLREYRRTTNTRSPEQWLSLRCFRSECFERWHVPSFLAALPIILEVALFFFFAGLLELLWTKHRVPFAFAVIIIGFAVTFYIATTLLPGIDIIRLVFRAHPTVHSGSSFLDGTMTRIPKMDYLCPYKSPQAWAMFKLLTWIFRPSSTFSRRIILHSLKKRIHAEYEYSPDDYVRFVRDKLHHLGDWFSVDLDIIERFSQIHDCPDMYGLKAHRWLTHEFRDIPLMLPHLQTLLQSLPPQLVMPGVFDHNVCRLDREWNTMDVEIMLERHHHWEPATPFIYSRLQLRLLTFHAIWTTDSNNFQSYFFVPFSREERRLLTPREHFVPLTRIFQMVLESDNHTMAFPCIMHFLQHPADIHLDASMFDFESIVPLLGSLATVDLRLSDIKGPLVDLLTMIDNKMRAVTYLLEPGRDFYSWIDGLDRFRVGQQLPKGYFDRHGGFFSVSVDRINTLLGNPTTDELALEYIKDYHRVLDTNNSQDFAFLFEHLRTYVLHNIPANPNNYPPHLQEELRKSEVSIGTSADEIPYVLQRQGILSFLVSFNAIVKGRAEELWFRYDWMSWEISLKCVAHLNGLPLNYFDSPNSLLNSSSNNVDAPGGVGGVSTARGPSTSAIEKRGNVIPGGGSSGPMSPLLTSLPQAVRGDEKPGKEVELGGGAVSHTDLLEGQLLDYLIGD
ncbi:hypothetical protein PQX77_005535 [Marasmius sp. AFHP31]|nr:hypothetical protein PQX77_005535 [Marasmius sp. AFHP31]